LSSTTGVRADFSIMNSPASATLITSCLVLCITDTSFAKAWRGIIPLHSTRADVRRLLGRPIIGEAGAIELYEREDGRVNVRYARRPCEQGLPADWGNWKVPRDTVVNISITLHNPILLSDLKVRNINGHKWYTDKFGATYYHDRMRGIEYQVQEGMVTAISYGPSARDTHLLCKKGIPLIRY
jgi:hypothetical protein